MVGIVVVSHSATLARGVIELAAQMAGEVPIAPAGGTTLEDEPLGTDAALVAQAIERVHSDDGVLVLMDLGSAVLSAEMAVDLLPEELRGRVLLCEAPLVEGAVAAAAAARIGRSLDDVAAEARRGLEAKAAHLRPENETGIAAEPAAPGPPASHRVRIAVDNAQGLHARPAARFVTTAGSFDAEVRVTNLTSNRGPADARSLIAVTTLDVQRGHEILVEASGPQAAEALDALRALAARGFGDRSEVAR